MTKPAKRVAVMLDLGVGFQRHTKVFSGILPYARSRGWSVIIDEYADDTLTGCTRGRLPYDGVIARATTKLAEQAHRLKLPVVNVWHNSPARQRLPGVFPDHQTCGRLRAEHLLLRGLKHFGALTGRAIGHQLNLQGFTATIHEAGFECATAYVSHTPSSTLQAWRQAESTIGRWIDDFELPIGVYVGEDEVARVVAQSCLNRGLRIPEEVAIVAGTNEALICEGPAPSLTSMELGLKRIGHEASVLLGNLMEGEPVPTKPLLLPPVGLIVRESTDFYAVDDETVGAALRFIADQSHRPIGPDQVAEALGISARTLQYRFKQCLGRAVGTEIRRVRLERAKRELTQNDRPLSDIARDVGFGTRIRMYQVFVRELAMTPSDYRKRHRHAELN
ncbi:MAG: substrate-binding domain-containing protein [Phycisphaeraceae bacterium]|nr:substrate-binding domain-containing protein [Phycisphaeraceae bacterium]